MDKILKFLDGRKTYTVAACLAVLVFLKSINKIDQATYDQLQVLLLGGGLAALRSAVTK